MNLRSYLRGGGLGLLTAALVLSFSGTNKTKAMTDDEVKARALELGMTDGNEVLSEAYTVAEAPEVAEKAEEADVPDVTENSAPSEAVLSENMPTEAMPTEIMPSETVSDEEEVSKAADGASEASNSTVTGSDEQNSEETRKTEDQVIEESLEGQQTTSLTSDLTGEDKSKSELLADAAETEAESASPITDSSSGFISVHINSGSTSTAVAKVLENAGAVSSALVFDQYLCANGYDRKLSTGDFRIPAGAGDEEIARILMRR